MIVSNPKESNTGWSFNHFATINTEAITNSYGTDVFEPPLQGHTVLLNLVTNTDTSLLIPLRSVLFRLRSSCII